MSALHNYASSLLVVASPFASLAFGRDTARYFQLIALLAAISTALWAVVFITTIVRVLAHFLWSRRRPQAPQALADKPISTEATG